MIETKNIGFLIVGCGRIAERYGKLFQNGKIIGGRLLAVSDVDAQKANTLAKETGSAAYTDMHKMMLEHAADADVVCILTESGNHARHCLDLVQYGKHILVEKPMALRVKDGEAMVQACTLNNIRLFVVKQNRFNRAIQLTHNALKAGRFGDLVMGTVRVRWCRDQQYYNQASWRGSWSMDGGVFANQASHHVDLLQWMLGNPVSVIARARTALADIEAEDTGACIVTFESGALGIIEATTATRPKDTEGSISLLGSKGMVEVGGFAANKIKVWQFDEPQDSDTDIISTGQELPADVYGFGHQAYLSDVVQSILGSSHSMVDGYEGMKSLRLVSAIYEAIETGREVFVGATDHDSRLGNVRVSDVVE